MFRSPVLSALVVSLGLAMSPAPAGAVEPDRSTPPAKLSPKGLRAFEREMAANPKFAKQVSAAAKSGDKQTLLKLLQPFVPAADVESLTIDTPTAKHVRKIVVKIVVKGGNSGSIDVPINP